jgi:hypothetical protein
MRAELKSVFSFDVPDLEAWAPDGDFGVLVTAFIGTRDSQASDAFEFTLCTPDWFKAQMQERPIQGSEHWHERIPLSQPLRFELVAVPSAA